MIKSLILIFLVSIVGIYCAPYYGQQQNYQNGYGQQQQPQQQGYGYSQSQPQQNYNQNQQYRPQQNQGYQQQQQQQRWPQQNSQNQNQQNFNQQQNGGNQSTFPFSDETLFSNPIYSNLTDDKKSEIEGILKDDSQSVEQMQQRLQALGATWPDYDQSAISEAVNEVGVTLGPQPADLTDEEFQFYTKKQAIYNNTNLTVAEMKRQLKELEDATPRGIQQNVEQKLEAQITTTPMASS